MQLTDHVTEARSGKTRVNIQDQERRARAVNGSSPAAKKAEEHYFKTGQGEVWLSTPLIGSGCEKNKELRGRRRGTENR